MAESTIVLVENEPATRSFLEQQLTDDGFDVLSAARMGDALELVETASPRWCFWTRCCRMARASTSALGCVRAHRGARGIATCP